MWSGVMLGSLVCMRLVMRSTLSTVLGPRRRIVVVEAGDASTLWCLVCVASAGYLWCACWRGCLDGGGLNACLPVELLPASGGCLCAWRWPWGSVRWALGGRGWVRVRVLVCTWCGLRGGLWAAGVLLPCAWRFVLSGGAWLVCALRGRCRAWSAWVLSVWVFGVGCWLWACRLRGVVGADGGVVGDVDGDGAAGDKGQTVMLAVTGAGAVGDVECGGVAGVAPGGW